MDSSFNISSLSAFKSKYNFREPSVLGTFSVDHNRNFVNDNSQLKYLVKYNTRDSIRFDLNVGFEKTVFKSNERTEKIDNILKWICHNKEKIPQLSNAPTFSLNSEFVCFRGLLTALFITPYESKERWIICAIKMNGTIYLCQFDTEESLKRNNEMTEKDILMCSYGYKFEQYMSSDLPKGRPDTDSPVNQKEEFCLAFRTRLNSHTILSSAEVDCLDSETPHNLLKISNARKLVELKTSRAITHPRQDRTLRRFKFLKWWAQSYIAGIPRIICGFRNDSGNICELVTYETLQLPDQAEGWDASVCINCGDQLLSFIKKHVIEDDPRTVYKFESIPEKKIMASKVPNDELSKFMFIPEWYIDWWSSITSTQQKPTLTSDHFHLTKKIRLTI